MPSRNMYDPSYWEATFSPEGPQKYSQEDFVSDVPLGNTNPTNVQGRIYDTPGNTPLNRAKGRLRSFEGKYPQ